MENNEIHHDVSHAVEAWQQMRRLLPRPVETSKGLIETLSFMILQIAADPSRTWREHNTDAVQRYAISVIPNLLNEVAAHYRFRRGNVSVITSWELWHGISPMLDKFCPIEKEG